MKHLIHKGNLDILYFDYNQPDLINRNLRNSVHIWQFFHNQNSQKEPWIFYPTILDKEELKRAKNYIYQKDRTRFIKDRRNLKKILSQYINCNPSDVKILYQQNGKPHITDDKIEFNVSHSGDLSVYAFSTGRKIGIDIEEIREIINIDLIMKYFYTKKESDQINGKKGLQRMNEFLKIWTQKEAVVKMFEMGISHIKREEEENSKYIVRRVTLHKKYVGALSHEN